MRGIEGKDGGGSAKAWYMRTLNIDEPLARVDYDSNTIRYYLTDALGSVIALADENGNVVARYNYGPWGETDIERGEPRPLHVQGDGRHGASTECLSYKFRVNIACGKEFAQSLRGDHGTHEKKPDDL